MDKIGYELNKGKIELPSYQRGLGLDWRLKEMIDYSNRDSSRDYLIIEEDECDEER